MHDYDTTRTSPFGYYVCCGCGWVSGQYRATAKEAYDDWTDHAREQRAGRPSLADQLQAIASDPMGGIR